MGTWSSCIGKFRKKQSPDLTLKDRFIKWFLKKIKLINFCGK